MHRFLLVSNIYHPLSPESLLGKSSRAQIATENAGKDSN